MKKNFIRQIVFAVALAVIASGFNSVQADYLPTEATEYYTPPPMPNVVLRKQGNNNKQYSDGIPWNKAEEGFWVYATSGTVITRRDQLTGQNCYLQDYTKTNQNYSTIGGALETRAYLYNQFDGQTLYIGVNTYKNAEDQTVSEFSTNQMRLGLGIIANENNDETSVVYDSSKAVDLSNVYLGHGLINSRLREGTYQYNENTGQVDDQPDDNPEISISTYSVVGMKGTLHVLPDSNQDSVFRSVIGNNNKNRHIVLDKEFTVVVPQGAKLEFLSASWDNNESHHPYSILPIYGEIVGDGKIQFNAQREDFILVYGQNNGFTGDVIIYTEDSTSSERYHHSAVVSGNGTAGSGIKGQSIHFTTGNLIIQNDQTLNNLSSDRASTATTRIGGTDAIVYNGFVDNDAYYNNDEYTPEHNLYETLTLYNDKPTTYYGAIGEAYEKTMTSGSTTIHYYDFTGAIKGLVKDGDETLSLYCAGSDGGIRAENFVISSGRVDFNGYFKGVLTVEADTVFSPDSWNWGNDQAIAVGDNSVKFYADDGTTIVKTYDAVTIDGDLVNNGGTIEFNFSKYDAGKNDVISFINDGTFDTSTGSFIDLVFMGDNPDPEAWATEDAKYLIVKGGGFEDKDYSYLLTGATGPYNGRHFALLGEGGNLYVVTVVPEPSTWALLILGAAGLLYWQKKKNS